VPATGPPHSVQHARAEPVLDVLHRFARLGPDEDATPCGRKCELRQVPASFDEQIEVLNETGVCLTVEHRHDEGAGRRPFLALLRH